MTDVDPAGDDELLTHLREVVEQVDQVPPAVLLDSRTALARRLVGHEVAELLEDSLTAAGVRADRALRLLSFRSGPVRLELEIEEAAGLLRVRGHATGVTGAVRVETVRRTYTVEVDADGFFTLDAEPSGTVRLQVVAEDGTPVTTSWLAS